MANGRENRDLCSTATQTTKPNTSSAGQRNSSITQYPSIRGFPERGGTRRNEKNRPGCGCFLKKLDEKPALPGSVGSTERKKKTCTRCYTRKETTMAPSYYQPEPFTESTVQFYESCVEPESWNSLLSPPTRTNVPIDAKQPRSRVSKSNRLTPQEVMSMWIPSRSERSTKGLFTPNENYIDMSPRDFSLKKYCPEMFLDEAEKAELRAKERQAAAEAVAPEPKCRGRRCSLKEPKYSEFNEDWKTILEDTTVSSPRLWNDEEIALARERDEVTEEELKPTPKTTSNRPSKWFRWFCGNSSKRKRKRGRDKQQDKES